MLIQASSLEVASTSDDPEQRLELVQGGYLASLGVYHELHCLVSLHYGKVYALTTWQRRFFWRFYEDIYFPNITESEREYEKAHAREYFDMKIRKQNLITVQDIVWRQLDGA